MLRDNSLWGSLNTNVPQHLPGTLTGAISLSKANKVCLCASVQVKQQLGRLVQGPVQTEAVSLAAGGIHIVHMSTTYPERLCIQRGDVTLPGVIRPFLFSLTLLPAARLNRMLRRSTTVRPTAFGHSHCI